MEEKAKCTACNLLSQPWLEYVIPGKFILGRAKPTVSVSKRIRDLNNVLPSSEFIFQNFKDPVLGRYSLSLVFRDF